MPELSVPCTVKAAFAEGRPYGISAEGCWCGTPGSCHEGSALQVLGVFVAMISPTITLQLLLWCLGALSGQTGQQCCACWVTRTWVQGRYEASIVAKVLAEGSVHGEPF